MSIIVVILILLSRIRLPSWKPWQNPPEMIYYEANRYVCKAPYVLLSLMRINGILLSALFWLISVRPILCRMWPRLHCIQLRSCTRRPLRVFIADCARKWHACERWTLVTYTWWLRCVYYYTYSCERAMWSQVPVKRTMGQPTTRTLSVRRRASTCPPSHPPTETERVWQASLGSLRIHEEHIGMIKGLYRYCNLL